MSNEILRAAQVNFNKNSAAYGLLKYVDERAYVCGFTEGVIHANNIWRIQLEMLQAQLDELNKKVQTDYPTLNRQQP